MKKLFTSKPFIISAFCLLSVGILATCWIVSRDDSGIFTPEPPQASAPVDDWVETSSGSEGSGALNPGANAEDKDAYPKIVEDNGQEVVIDFTPTQSSAPEPPEVPAGKTETAETGSDHPVNPDPKVTAPEPSKPSGPAPGSTNENGEFYDPVFGWVKPGQVNQQDVDSEGDPNKMVGNMGD